MEVIVVDSVLFDMDGTLIDSTPGVMKAWTTFGKDYGIDPEVVAHASHGRRLYDTLKEFCKIDDEERLLAEIARFEEEVIVGGPVALPGVLDLLKQIETTSHHGEKYHWTIVTSATNYYTPRALAKCGVPLPPAGLVTSNDVTRGKPFPDPYLAGAERCKSLPANCVVVEDAPSGLSAGRAAGCKTIAVCTSHTRQALEESGVSPDYIVTDLTKVTARAVDGHIELVLDTSP